MDRVETSLKRVVEERPPDWAAYASIPVSFEVRSMFDVAPSPADRDGVSLTERSLTVPYIKDYDVLGDGVQRWSHLYDPARWGVLAAFVGDDAGHTRAGGDTVAYLWDLRVAPAWRRGGIGQALFGAAESWARARGCTELRVETQNINVAACRFYRRQGCSLVHVDTAAYPELPGEVRLIWSRTLTR
jgi:ribosomal protein S18 acetylase RimI-like enzyme